MPPPQKGSFQVKAGLLRLAETSGFHEAEKRFVLASMRYSVPTSPLSSTFAVALVCERLSRGSLAKAAAAVNKKARSRRILLSGVTISMNGSRRGYSCKPHSFRTQRG